MGGSSVMIGGEGPKSYAQNSAYQGSVVEIVKLGIEAEINTKLDIKQLSLTNPKCFYIVDFGCATGHNSFRTIEVIVDAVQKKFKTEGQTAKIPEFHVFFNDQVMNDFNTLFHSLPPERRYHVAGVPGSFQCRLFPKDSLHYAHSSWSLHWLSEVPNAVTDKTSVAWNKGKIHYEGAQKEVIDSYSLQYAKDINSFLEARAQELVNGGLMTLLIPAVPNFWDPETIYIMSTGISILGSCLVDMANEGIISEEEIDSCNIPLYLPTPQELETIIENSHNFSIERTEILNNLRSGHGYDEPNAIASFCRSAMEGVLRDHFTIEIIDESFHRFQKKISAPSIANANDKTIVIFVVLKCKK